MTSPRPIAPPTSPTPARLRGGTAGSLGRALGAVAALGILLGLTQLAVGIWAGGAAWAVGAFTALFWVWLGAGILAWTRRPGNGMGALLVVASVGVFLGGAANMQVPVLAVVGSIFATSVLAVTVHLLHAFPSGRLRGALSRATVVAGYLVAVGGDFVTTTLEEANLADAGAVRAVNLAQSVAGIAVMAVTAVLLARRLAGAEPRHRRVLLPLFLYGILAVLLIPTTPLVLRALGAGSETTFIVQLLLIAGLPIAFLIGILRGGFARTTPLDALSAWLAVGGATRPAVQRALAATLGDETLRVVYRSSATGGFVDDDGVAASREDGIGQAWIDVRVEDRLVGAIGYDPRLTADAAEVRRAGEVLAVAIDRERLTTELLAANEQLTRSRLRLVEAEVRERARIARDLHDGLQVELVLLALRAQTIANAPEATPALRAELEGLRHGIDESAAGLRRLVHGVIPAALVEQGLATATEDLVDRLPVPATLVAEIDGATLGPATTHTAYFVVAEVLANAVKHARAGQVGVRLTVAEGRLRIEVDDDGVGGARLDRGTGLRGLADRVDVLGGAMEVTSPVGGGTRVEVALPCV